MNDIKLSDLRQIKGLGPKKANIIASLLKGTEDPTTLTEEDLGRVKGISPHLAEEVISLVQSEGEPLKPVKKATRKKATKRTPEAAVAQRSGNGRITLKAGLIRRVAREYDAVGDTAEAAKLRSIAADLLDDEPVPHDRFA